MHKFKFQLFNFNTLPITFEHSFDQPIQEYHANFENNSS